MAAPLMTHLIVPVGTDLGEPQTSWGTLSASRDLREQLCSVIGGVAQAD